MSRQLIELRAYAEDNGGITAVASSLGVSKGVFWAWLNRGQVPPEWCPIVERETGIPRWHLRPADWHRIWPELVEASGAPATDDRPAPDEPDPERSGPNLPKSGNGPSVGMEPISGNEQEKATACGA